MGNVDAGFGRSSRGRRGCVLTIVCLGCRHNDVPFRGYLGCRRGKVVATGKVFPTSYIGTRGSGIHIPTAMPSLRQIIENMGRMEKCIPALGATAGQTSSGTQTQGSFAVWLAWNQTVSLFRSHRRVQNRRGALAMTRGSTGRPSIKALRTSLPEMNSGFSSG